MKFAYDIVRDKPNKILITDRCDEHGCMSITNAAELVIEDLHKKGLLSPEKRVYYEDTMGAVDELCHDGEKFTGFAFGES